MRNYPPQQQFPFRLREELHGPDAYEREVAAFGLDSERLPFLHIGAHMREQVIPCWRGLCTQGCTDWTAAEAYEVYHALLGEFDKAPWPEIPAAKDTVDVLITTSWLMK